MVDPVGDYLSVVFGAFQVRSPLIAEISDVSASRGTVYHSSCFGIAVWRVVADHGYPVGLKKYGRDTLPSFSYAIPAVLYWSNNIHLGHLHESVAQAWLVLKITQFRDCIGACFSTAIRPHTLFGAYGA